MISLFRKKPKQDPVVLTEEIIEKALAQVISKKLKDSRDRYGRSVDFDDTVKNAIQEQVTYALNRIVDEKISSSINDLIAKAVAERSELILKQFENGEFTKQVMKEAVARLIGGHR